MTSTPTTSHLDLTGSFSTLALLFCVILIRPAVVRVSEIKWNPTYGSELPNLYVQLQFDNVKRRTKTVKRSLTPDYDELLSLELKPGGQRTKVNIQVKHDSTWKDRCVGEIDVEFSDLLARCANSKVTELRLNMPCGSASVETAAVLHLRLEAASALMVASRNIDATEQAIQERGIPHADLCKSVGTLVSKLDVLGRVMDVLSQDVWSP
ncbi:uncharacterized protein FOMMEDRAFT_31857 [Fomitiporia mediterranea MF3/22]|uniref:uncharacterized protein n=1 Tax=Fomitiporia mediterranea (strain MF3/22) TaxID=694068 RepID=UPI000440747D|nr:uncharacterized protein FOMMEDRAFT_31857 [Fomitiporia mediterranea MF3/22]EJC98390.1 hypothetical protein FOMMEDRAFT_31857 [Fomitiporia mediterranea MF3/22]